MQAWCALLYDYQYPWTVPQRNKRNTYKGMQNCLYLQTYLHFIHICEQSLVCNFDILKPSFLSFSFYSHCQRFGHSFKMLQSQPTMNALEDQTCRNTKAVSRHCLQALLSSVSSINFVYIYWDLLFQKFMSQYLYRFIYPTGNGVSVNIHLEHRLSHWYLEFR